MVGSGTSATRVGRPPSHSNWSPSGAYIHRPSPAAAVASRNGISRLARSFRASRARTQTAACRRRGPPTVAPRGGRQRIRRCARETATPASRPHPPWRHGPPALGRHPLTLRPQSPKSRSRHCSAGRPSAVAVAALRPRMAPSSVSRADGQARRRSSSEASICGSLRHTETASSTMFAHFLAMSRLGGLRPPPSSRRAKRAQPYGGPA